MVKQRGRTALLAQLRNHFHLRGNRLEQGLECRSVCRFLATRSRREQIPFGEESRVEGLGLVHSRHVFIVTSQSGESTLR